MGYRILFRRCQAAEIEVEAGSVEEARLKAVDAYDPAALEWDEYDWEVDGIEEI